MMLCSREDKVQKLLAAIDEDDLATVLEMLLLQTRGLRARNYNPLHRAAHVGLVECLSYLLQKPAFASSVNEKCIGSWTPLLVAVANQNLAAAQVLLESSYCDANCRDSSLENALHIEAEYGSPSADMVHLLIQHGTDTEAINTGGQTALQKSVEFHNLVVLEHLLSHGCQVNTKSSSDGSSPLHSAVSNGYEDIVQYLIAGGSHVNSQDNNLQTPLMTCVQQKRDPHLVFNILKYLIDAKSDLNYQDIGGNTALLLAMSNPTGIRKHHIELLLVSGADPNIANRQGLTAIWQAVYTCTYNLDRLDIVQLLLQENCCLNMSCRGKLLFRCGPDFVFCYETLMTPFEVAMDSGLYDTAKMLVFAGCRVKGDLRFDTQFCTVPHELIWFQDLLVNPSSLQQQCRLTVRKVLGRAIHSKVRKLPLPDRLKRYLLLEDVLFCNK